MRKQIIIVSPTPPSSSLLEELRNVAGTEETPLVLRDYPSREELRKIGLDRDNPVVFLVDCTEERQGFRVLRDVGFTNPGARSVVLNGPRRLSTLIRAKQHGATGYLSDFHSSTDLRRLALYLNGSRADGHEETSEGRLVSFLPAQGGSGASTIALHVATTIGQCRQGKCLLLDFDLHTGTIGFQLGLQSKHSLVSVLSEPRLSGDNLRQAATTAQGIDAIVGTTGADQPDPSVFRRTTEFVSLMQQTYSYSFVDLPPATLSSTIDVLQRSHLVYLVCTPEITSLHLALRKVSYLQSCGISADKVRVLVNRASSWGGLDVAGIEKVVGKPIEWLIDNDYQAVRQSALSGGLVSQDSALHQQFALLGMEILGELDYIPGPAVEYRAEKRNGVNTRMFG